MKKYIKYSMFVLLSLWFMSCNDFIDTTPKDRVSDKLVWETERNAMLSTLYFYKYIHDYGTFGSAQFKGSDTEGLTETFKYGSYVPGGKAGDANLYAFTPETMSATGNLLNTWTTAYEGIRRVNQLLDSQAKYSQLEESVNNRMSAELRFFRAFLYFQLAKRHGSVILYTDMNLEMNKDRAPESEVWDLIESDLKFAAEHLPIKWDASNTGRVSKGAAYAMTTRAMLYAKRWQSVVDAGDALLALTDAGYKLAADYTSATKGGNSESILEYNYLLSKPNHDFDKSYAVYGELAATGGSGVPTQEMVESYEKADGTKVDWSAWHSSTTKRPPYEQLEPRFHASIFYNGAKWKGKTIENSVNGNMGRYMAYREDTYTLGRTVTGYYLRKFRDEKLVDLATYNSTTTWVELRLAEVYLNRAEAYYNLNNSAKALADLNTVRERVNLPSKTGISGDALFNAIRQERKVELYMEGHLFWDMRRWKLSDKEYNNYRVHGMKISKGSAQGEWLYEYVDSDLEDRKFLKRLYVLPIPQDELVNNSGIQQFDEWR